MRSVLGEEEHGEKRDRADGVDDGPHPDPPIPRCGGEDLDIELVSEKETYHSGVSPLTASVISPETQVLI